MRISYNPLWKILIDKGMNKRQLREKSGISTASMAKLGKGENITTDVLLRICEALDCNINQIMESVPDSNSMKNKETMDDGCRAAGSR
ncbi:helix-turn-helix domain-containing protein [Lactimicrobium massiliense]|uniref:helix-turn-helix domain-containing protein n=1 Tax=Lactimicrobium massiliense TaxID=2161814 RepID=UPI000D55DDD2|nr:helix-turn-helix domain-containing protein [Lactimicrobium massiliense]